jgi:2-polyprenyl-3-methyl-5-hydroxy-6-metoxy-1,4-benzoquinol methylase
MQELRNDGKLSSRDYWDEVLVQADLPRISTRRAYHQRITMDFVDEFISKGDYKSFFEVGCGSSGWLPYFALKYNLVVSGIDYSVPGCRLAEQNLKMLEIPYGEIICKDIFEPDCTGGKKYDIVFSYGVIEHFEHPEDLIRIFAGFLNPGGLLISLVPNLNGLMGSISRYFVKDIFNMHKVMDAAQLREFHEFNDLVSLKTSFAGTFTLSVLPLVKSKIWVYKQGSLQRKITSFLVGTLDKASNNFLKLTGINLTSRFLSPYIICVARKNKTLT